MSPGSGRLAEIYIAPAAGAPMQYVKTIEAVTGIGLQGDRYAVNAGTFSTYPGARDVTLMALEKLRDFERAFGITVHPSQMRRNLITEDIDPQDLIGIEFQIGGVRLRGLKPCPPCLYLAHLLKIPEILRGFARCGGIYAEVLNDGKLSAGDAIVKACDS